MKELEKIKAKFREMVAYCMDTKDSEVVDNYTETFLAIYKEGVAKIEKEQKEELEQEDNNSRACAHDLKLAEQELQTLKDAVREKVNEHFLNLNSPNYNEELAKEFRDILNSKN